LRAWKVLEFRKWISALGLRPSVDFSEIDKFDTQDTRDLRDSRAADRSGDARDPFLRAVAIELARYQPEAIGPGLINRVGRELQRQFLTPSLGSVPHSRAWWD
jgi:hypothetical protein